MTPAARLSAAIELIETSTPSAFRGEGLKEVGQTAHRFAGSGDRASFRRRLAGNFAAPARFRAPGSWSGHARARNARHAQARTRHGAAAISNL